jgi:hypothetical protein
MSKLLFDIPPTGGAPAVTVLKNGEMADRLADFIEVAPLACDLVGSFGRVLTSNAECMVTVCFLKREESIKKQAMRISEDLNVLILSSFREKTGDRRLYRDRKWQMFQPKYAR